MSDSATEPVVYTPEQRSLIIHKVNALHASGEPGMAINLKHRMLTGEEIRPGEYMEGVHPEKKIAEDDMEKITPPGRTGPGSGKDKWVAWALLVMDIDEEMLEALGRDDIIILAQERGVLPKG